MKFVLFLLLLTPVLLKGEAPFDPSDKIFPLVEKQLKGQRDISRRFIKRLGNNTIEMEVFAATDGDYQLAKTIFPNFARYGEWTLHNINKNSSGGEYVLQINDLKHNPKDSITQIFYQLKLPVFKHKNSRGYKIRTVEEEKTLVIEVEAVPVKDSFIAASQGRFYIWPKDKHTLWFYFRGHIKLASWLIYEALPEQVVLRESGERIQTLLVNYQNEENRLYALESKRAAAQVSTRQVQNESEPEIAPTK